MTGSGLDVLLVGGGAVASFRTIVVDGVPWHEDVEPLLPVAEVVPHLLSAWSGHHVVSQDVELADALLSAGAAVARQADVMSFDIDGSVDPGWRSPNLPAGLLLTPADRPARTLAATALAAYPPGHPDHEADTEQAATSLVERLLTGVDVGPLLSASCLVVDGDDVVAFALVNRMPGRPPQGGPWLTDVARRPSPRYAGLGTAMIRHVIAELAETGETSLGLAVTSGNPARAVYDRLGFRHVVSSRRLRLP